jgi:predicted MFS family arabinose efflux permease
MSTSPEEARSSRSWRERSVRLAVALAFADASIVVLALPQIVDQLHTSISHVTWVIMAYNLALILGVVGFLPLAGRVPPRRALLVGLGVFGVGSLGCATANSLALLVALRGVQGVGGALVVCASLPLLASAARPEESPTAGWAAAAALGAAIGPAAGGVLTQLFDWRAIFVAQAPAAVLAAAAVLASREPGRRIAARQASRRSDLGPLAADIALLLLSAGLIGALFLVVVLLINVWQLSPIGAAAVLSAIPLATLLVERLARRGSAILFGVAGALLVAVGLAAIALVSHRQLGWVIIALALCGAGIGLAFTSLTAAALGADGAATTRAGRTVVARDAGLVIGLLILTPVFVHDLNGGPQRATPAIAGTLLAAPIPGALKGELAGGLIQASNSAPQSGLPDIARPFAEVRAHADPSSAAPLDRLRHRISSEIERAATRSFRRSLLYSALFALLVIPVLVVAQIRQRRGRL